jgi:hypothetical protein
MAAPAFSGQGSKTLPGERALTGSRCGFCFRMKMSQDPGPYSKARLDTYTEMRRRSALLPPMLSPLIPQLDLLPSPGQIS